MNASKGIYESFHCHMSKPGPRSLVGIVDADLIKDKEYAQMGKNLANRVKTLIGTRLHEAVQRAGL